MPHKRPLDDASAAAGETALKRRLGMMERKVRRLETKIEMLEKVVRLSGEDPWIRWLHENRNERMDATVDIHDPLRSAFHLARYRFAASYVDGKRVADVACGTGYGSKLLCEAGAKHVIGIDICPEAIRYATERHQHPSVEYKVASADATCLKNESIDVVVSFETVEHVEDDQLLLAEFHRILRPGGLLICSTPNDWPLEISPHHQRQYDRDSFTSLLESRFTVVDLFNQNSGSDFKYNHSQPGGIAPTTEANFTTAECYLAVGRKAVNDD